MGVKSALGLALEPVMDLVRCGMESEVVPRKPYPTDVTDEEWAFVALNLTLMAPDAPQRRHDLRALLRWSEGRADAPTAVILDACAVQSTPESGGRAGWDGHKRRKGSKTHAAVDTLGHPLALRITPADAQEREQVGALAAAVQEATGENVEVAFVDQGYAGDEAAAAHGISLEVVKPPEAKRGFVLLPRRWVVERSFAWAARYRRLARDYERLPKTFAGLHFVAFACLMLRRLRTVVAQRP
jgi:transposase